MAGSAATVPNIHQEALLLDVRQALNSIHSTLAGAVRYHASLAAQRSLHSCCDVFAILQRALLGAMPLASREAAQIFLHLKIGDAISQCRASDMLTLSEPPIWPLALSDSVMYFIVAQILSNACRYGASAARDKRVLVELTMTEHATVRTRRAKCLNACTAPMSRARVAVAAPPTVLTWVHRDEAATSISPTRQHQTVSNMFQQRARNTLAHEEVVMSLTVSDFGPGMSDEQLRLITEPFSILRALNQQLGSGLGLASAAEYVNSNGGEIMLSRGVSGRGMVVTVAFSSDMVSEADSRALRQQAQAERSAGSPMPVAVWGTYDLPQGASGTYPRARESASSGESIPVDVMRNESHQRPDDPAAQAYSLDMDRSTKSLSDRLVYPTGAQTRAFANIVLRNEEKVLKSSEGGVGMPAPVGSTRRGRKSPKSAAHRIMLVDDVATTRRLVTGVLRRARFAAANITQAADGVEAMALWRKLNQEGRSPHTIITDGQMAPMDGYALVRALREAGYDGRIIGLTGNAARVDVERFFDAGTDHVLLKPVNARALLEHVQPHACAISR